MANILEYGIDTKSAFSSLKQLEDAINKSGDQGTKAGDKIQSAFDKVSRTLLQYSDKEAASNERLVKSYESKALAIGKSVSDQLIAQRDKHIKQLGDNVNQVERLTKAYDTLIKASGESGGLKSFGESIKQFIENPTQSAGNAITGLLEKMGPAGVIFAGVATAGVALGATFFEMAKSGSEAAEAVVNLSAQTGVSISQLDKWSAMGKIVGVDMMALARTGQSMAETLDQGGTKSQSLTNALDRLHVSVIDGNGAWKDQGQLIVETIENLSKMQAGTERNALASEVLGARVSKAIEPILGDYDKLQQVVTGLGYGIDSDIQKADGWAQMLHTVGLAWDEIGRKAAAYFESEVKFESEGGDGLLGKLYRGVQSANGRASSFASAVAGTSYGSQQGWKIGSVVPPVPAGPDLGALQLDLGRNARTSIDEKYSSQIDTLKSQLAEEQKTASGMVRGGAVLDPAAYDKAKAAIKGLQDQIKSLEEAATKAKEDARSLAEARAKMPIGPLPSEFYGLQMMLGETMPRNRVELTKQLGASGGVEKNTVGDYAFRHGLQDQDDQLKENISDLTKALRDGTEANREIERQAQQRAEVLQRIAEQQHEEVSHTASGLFASSISGKRGAFTNELRSMSSKYASKEFGDTVADILVPGGNKTKNELLKVGLDANTQATMQNTAALYAHSQMTAATMGTTISVPSSVSVGGSDVGSVSVPTVSVPSAAMGIPSYSGAVPAFGGSTSGFAFPSIFGGGSPGGTPGFAGPVSFGGWSGGVSSIPGLFKGGMSGLKGIFHGTPVTNTAGVDPDTGQPTFSTSGGGPSPAESMGASLAVSGGSQLAMAGLFGNRRGTGGGMAESVGGMALTGAGLGFMFGGPLGAGIGAAAGAAAGAISSGIEMMIGDVSPATKAKQQVKTKYGITISTQMANQIASLAQSKYGGNVNVATSSPEVRQMLGVYAAGTGQNAAAATAMTPHAAGLTESGGNLYQSAQTMYGQSYSFNSGLPVMGGVSGTSYSPPSGYPGSAPIQMSFNVEGSSTSDFLSGNVFTPAAIQNGIQQNRVANSAMVSQPGLLT